ncbi:MAG TPA: hypothetical protein DD424_05610 [Porphyromonadaceae bacterium]|nr:hypothetical protein [Porphyromonadaceae bacterium]
MEATLPVSEEVLKYCGKRGEGLIFKGFRRSMAQQPFKKWVKAAGIERKLSFHCLRHSFAMLLISLDIDVSVVSKMFTHRSVKTTMIYADVVSEKKRGRCLYPLLFRQLPKHPVPSVGTFRRPPRNP